MYNNPKWLSDWLRQGDKIIRDGEARDYARQRDKELIDKAMAGEAGGNTGATSATGNDIVDGVTTLIAGAVGIVGLFVGGGIGGWIGAILLGAGGFVGTTWLFMFAGDRIRGRAEKRLWRQRPGERTSADLREYWEAKFGAPIRDELIDEIDLNGAAWVMDKDAYCMMLARLSAGSDSVKPQGTKKANARMWAAAKLLGLKVNGYHPDAYALETYKQMQREFKEIRP